jgi:hypothetical protein
VGQVPDLPFGLLTQQPFNSRYHGADSDVRHEAVVNPIAGETNDQPQILFGHE